MNKKKSAVIIAFLLGFCANAHAQDIKFDYKAAEQQPQETIKLDVSQIDTLTIPSPVKQQKPERRSIGGRITWGIIYSHAATAVVYIAASQLNKAR
jgi:hypothetical protein